jgi:hypothetical protein
MVRVEFRSEALRDRCVDLSAMTSAWGSSGSQAVQLGLHQLCAVEDLDDLGFLPCPVIPGRGGKVGWELGQGLTMVLSEGETTRGTGGRPDVTVVVVEEIRRRNGDSA